MRGIWRTLMAAVLLAFLSPMAPAAAEKISVLIIDGQHNHNWAQTTPLLKDMLIKSGRFNVDVLTSPPAKAAKEAWDNFRPPFAKYQVIMMNYHGTPWPDEVKQSFEKYMNDGGGLVAYHAAVFAFPEWDAWNRMIGLGWRPNTFGERITIDDAGNIVRTPKGEGPGGGHGPAHPFEMKLRDADHPITKGMPATWMHIKDELYHGQRGPAQNMHILASAFSAKDKGGSGTNEPMAWTIPVGKGRSFVSLLGHSAAETVAPDTVAFLCRGAEWVATGEVTLPPHKAD